MKGMLSPVAVTNVKETASNLSLEEGGNFSNISLFNIVTLAPVSTNIVKGISCICVETNNPSSPNFVAFIVIFGAPALFVSHWPPCLTGIGFPVSFSHQIYFYYYRNYFGSQNLVYLGQNYCFDQH